MQATIRPEGNTKLVVSHFHYFQWRKETTNLHIGIECQTQSHLHLVRLLGSQLLLKWLNVSNPLSFEPVARFLLAFKTLQRKCKPEKNASNNVYFDLQESISLESWGPFQRVLTSHFRLSTVVLVLI